MTPAKRRTLFRQLKRNYGRISCTVVARPVNWDVTWTECPVCREKPDSMGVVQHKFITIKKLSEGDKNG